MKVFFHIYLSKQKEFEMKKATGIVLAMVMAGVLLAGCYSKACEPMAQPMMYKGEG